MSTAALFPGVSRIRLSLLLLFVGLHVALKGVFFSHAFLQWVADPLYDLTSGVVTHSTAAGIVEMAILLTYLAVLARATPTQLGMRRADLLNAVIVTTFLWSLVQTVSVVIGRIDGGLLDFGRAWYGSGPVLWAGLLEAHAGGAFIEEIVYRGFLLPQLFLLGTHLLGWRKERSLVVAVLCSQAYFALNHVPAAARAQLSPAAGVLYVAEVFFVGVLFAAIYLRTGNLFMAVGCHALMNFPGALFVSRIDPFFLVLVVSCAILMSWPYLNRRLGDVFTVRPAPPRTLFAASSG